MSFFYDLNKRLATLASKQDQRLDESKAAVEESKFSKLTKELSKNPEIENPAAVAATIGRKNYGQKAMIKKSIAGKMNATEDATWGQQSSNSLEEKWTGDTKLNPEKKGMFKGKTKGELVSRLAKLKAKGPHSKGSPEYTKMKELQFAIRAKGDWGSIDEEETDEGNAFTGKLASTPKGVKFKLGNKEFKDTSSIEEADPMGLEEGFEEMDNWLKSREKEKGTGKFDVKDTGYSKRYTRKGEDEPEDKDNEEATIAIKKKGRPTGSKHKTGAKHSGRSKLASKDAIAEEVPVTDRGEYNDEAGMAKDSLHTIVRHAKELESALHSNENLPEWVQEKIGQIKGMMSSVTDYIISTHERGIENAAGEEGFSSIEEKAPPGAKAERMVKHIKKGYSKDGELTPKEKSIAYATSWKAHNKGQVEEEGAKPDFLDVDKDGDRKESFKKAVTDKTNKQDTKAEKAGKKVTKDIEYDDNKDKEERPRRSDKEADDSRKRDPRKTDKEEKVDETTTAGSVATASVAPKASKGGMQFGKGVYESLTVKLESMISESISVQENIEECGMEGQEPSITITASGEEAAKLMALLKLAGLEGKQEVCPTCGSANCQCNELDENSPDWPTNTEKLEAQPELRTYSGGLNGPKSTGQTTTPVIASQLRRQVSMEENVELERSLFKTWKNYKG